MVLLNELVDDTMNLLNFDKFDKLDFELYIPNQLLWLIFFPVFLKVCISLIFNNTVMDREQDVFEFILLKILK